MKYKCTYDILSLNHCNDKSNCTISRRIQRNLNNMQISQSEEANKGMRIPNSKLLLFSHSSISFVIKHITTYVYKPYIYIFEGYILQDHQKLFFMRSVPYNIVM